MFESYGIFGSQEMMMQHLSESQAAMDAVMLMALNDPEKLKQMATEYVAMRQKQLSESKSLADMLDVGCCTINQNNK